MKRRSTYLRILLVLFLQLALTRLQAQEGDIEQIKDEPEKKEVIDFFTERNIPQKKHSHLLKDPEYAYANDPEYWIKETEKPSRMSGLSRWFEKALFSEVTRFLFYCLLVVVGIVVIYRLVALNGFFYKKASLNQGEQQELADEMITLQNIDALLQAALHQSDFARAVRLQYIKTLLLLDHEQWIQYNAQSTNTDYLYKLRTAPFFEEFDLMTSVYDHVCYGGFDINRLQFEMISDRFVHLQNKLRR